MCGIVGFVWRGGDAVGTLKRMLARVAHRGPDAEGTFIAEHGPWQIALGHRRLSIIDLETGGQPMPLVGGRHHITYNGEVYNFAELRPALEVYGHRFATRSDTEVVAAHAAQFGPSGLADLNGMFAFALWDQEKGHLLLARDRAGIKPLYYASLPDGGLAFASELSALQVLDSLPRAVSRPALASYLFCDYVQAPGSMVSGIFKLAPGCHLEWQDGRIGSQTRYWHFPAPRPAGLNSEVETTWQTLSDAVERDLVADVPVGIFLSGGLDSSIVATLASRRAGARMKAFSIGFRDPSFDESVHARRLAETLGLEYVEDQLDEANLLAVTDVALGKLDEPLADPSFLPTYLLSELAARHVKVVMSGDGGDELWAGYPTYLAHSYARVLGRVPARARHALTSIAMELPTSDRYQSFEWKLKRFLGRYDDDPLRRHLRWMSSLDLDELGAAGPGLGDCVPETLEFAPPRHFDSLNRFLALDFSTYLPGSVLTKVDRATMAHGLEARPAFLDNAVIDWAFSLPGEFKLHRGTRKYLLKQASRQHLPRDVLRRPKKGFGIPLARWMRGPLAPRMTAILADSPVFDLHLLYRDVFENWFEEHQHGKRDASKPLWALLVLDRWLRQAGLTT